MRIKASEQGARVVAAAAPAESRPARKEEEPEEAPPLETGQTVAVAEKAAPKGPAAADAERDAKPPPPHIARGGKPAPPRRPAAAETRSPGPATVKIAEVAPRPAPKAEAEEKQGEPALASGEIQEAHAKKAAPAAAPPSSPEIHTDAGRHSALSSAMGIIFLVFLLEVGAGVAGNSLALFSDAGHTFMDLFSYGVAFAAVTVSQRKSNERETYGGHRAEIVAAFISGVLLIIVVIVIYLEALQRLVAPEQPDLTYMLTVPWIAIASNLYLARRFAGAKDLNMRGARMHVLSDLFSAFGVLGAGLIIAVTQNPVFDPLASFFIGFLILRSANQLLRESGEILLERTPAHLKVADLTARIEAVPGVEGVHAIHAWSLCSTVHALSAHVVTPATGAEAAKLLEGIRAHMAGDFSIQYTTIQLERAPCGAEKHPTVQHTAAEAVAHVHHHV